MKAQGASSTAAGCDLESDSFAPHNQTEPVRSRQRFMPTVTRFVMTIGIVAALVYGVMFALATFVKPRIGEMTVEVPIVRPKPAEPAAAP